MLWFVKKIIDGGSRPDDNIGKITVVFIIVNVTKICKFFMKEEEIMSATQNGSKPWIMLMLVLLAAIAPPLAMFKVAPVMEMIQDEYAITAAQGGLVSTLFSLVPIILSIPVGILVSKYGNYRLGLAALFFVIIGSALGAVSGSLSVLLLSRVIEGISMALICTVGPAIVNEIIPAEQRGKAMGIFLWYISLGQAFISTVTPAIIRITGGWRGIWWFTFGYSLIFLILWFIFLRGLKSREAVSTQKAVAEQESSSIFEVMKNRDLWLLTLCIFAFMISIQGILAFYPAFFTQAKGLESMKAIRLTGVHGYIGCAGAVVSGFIMDKTGAGKWKWMGVVVMIASAVLYSVLPVFPASMAIIIILLVGFTVNMMPPLIYAIVPEVCRSPWDIAMAMGIVNTGMNLGTFVSAILFGAILDRFGWNAAFFFSAAMAAVCTLCMLLLRNTRK